MRRFSLIIIGLAMGLAQQVHANEVEIVNVYLNQTDSGWSADVTLKHADSGWEHYADAWRIVNAAGHLIKTRVLYHPHVNEQPFTRSLSNIPIAEGTDVVYVEAHDKRHGWSSQRVKIDLTRSSGDRYHIRRK